MEKMNMTTYKNNNKKTKQKNKPNQTTTPKESKQTHLGLLFDLRYVLNSFILGTSRLCATPT